jgi:nitrite reductase (NO-forming)
MGSGLAGTWYGRLRLVHSHLNLIGLVGLTILGTLPAILPTFAHQKVVSGREAQLGWWLAAGSVTLIAAGLVVGEEAVGLGSVLAGISLLVVLAGVIGRLGRRGLEGRLAYHQVGIGCGWLAVWAILDGGRLLAGSTAGPFGAWTGVGIVAGVGQVLLGSLAYLLPVLAGPAPRLPRNLDRMNGRMLLPLTFADLAGGGFAAGLVQLAAAATGLWVLDFAYRLSRIEWRDRESGAMS